MVSRCDENMPWRRRRAGLAGSPIVVCHIWCVAGALMSGTGGAVAMFG